MATQNYTIYFEGLVILITGNEEFAHSHHATLLTEKEIVSIVRKIQTGEHVPYSIVACVDDHPAQVLKEIKRNFYFIKAAGGIVFSEDKELLLIKRHGLWDLPKGKLEKGEDVRLAALREVHEECGLNFLGLVRKNTDTYHAYRMKGKWCLKKTTWFNMIAWGTKAVKPQIEEGITEVKWVNQDFIQAQDFETYESLKGIFKELKFP